MEYITTRNQFKGAAKMSEKKCECKCNSNTKEFPVIIGGIVIYELAIIIIMLVLIFFELDVPCATELEETPL